MLSEQNKFLQYYISNTFKYLINSSIIKDDNLYIHINKNNFLILIKILKRHTFFNFNSLMDVWGLDFPKKKKRFSVNYLLMSSSNVFRIIAKANNLVLEHHSIANIFPSAGWLEREVWDMFGIFFIENKDLRRILTDYGFEGFPLRKDFPLSGFSEIRYDYEQKRIVYDPIEFIQEYRHFYFQKSWIK